MDFIKKGDVLEQVCGKASTMGLMCSYYVVWQVNAYSLNIAPIADRKDPTSQCARCFKVRFNLKNGYFEYTEGRGKVCSL